MNMTLENRPGSHGLGKLVEPLRGIVPRVKNDVDLFLHGPPDPGRQAFLRLAALLPLASGSNKEVSVINDSLGLVETYSMLRQLGIIPETLEFKPDPKDRTAIVLTGRTRNIGLLPPDQRNVRGAQVSITLHDEETAINWLTLLHEAPGVITQWNILWGTGLAGVAAVGTKKNPLAGVGHLPLVAGVAAVGTALTACAYQAKKYLDNATQTPQGRATATALATLTATPTDRLPTATPGPTIVVPTVGPDGPPSPPVEVTVEPFPKPPEPLPAVYIDKQYLLDNGNTLKDNKPNTLPLPTPIPDTGNNHSSDLTPEKYTESAFTVKKTARNEFDYSDPLNILKRAVIEGARQGQEGVTYFQPGILEGEDPAFSGLSIYREQLNIPRGEYTITEGYPRGLVLRNGAGISVVGRDSQGNFVVAFEEYFLRQEKELKAPRMRFAVLTQNEFAKLSTRFLPNLQYFFEKDDQIKFTDRSGSVAIDRIAMLNTLDDEMMELISQDAGILWIDRIPKSVNEKGEVIEWGDLHPNPVVRRPDPEVDEIPEGVNIDELFYTIIDIPYHRGKTKSIKILATDQEGNLSQVGEYNEVENTWKWRNPYPQDTPLLVSGSSYVLGKVEGSRFVEGDKQIRMTGAICTKFVTQNSERDPRGESLPAAKEEINALVKMGANFVIFEWNSGEEYLGNTHYVPSLVDAIKYANSHGLRVELVLHSRGKDSNTNWKEKQITVLDDKIVTDWQKLLADEKVASDLADCVDIFGVLSEAEWDTSGNRVSIYNPNLWDAAATIRSLLKKPDALCTFSIGEWGAEAQELEGVPQEMIDRIQSEKIVIEIHQYLEQNRKRDLDYILRLQAKGLPIIIGETGQLPWDDPEIAQEYYQEVLDFINAHGLSFAWFAIDIWNTNPNDRNIHIYNGNGITDWGKKVKTGFVNYIP